MVMAKLIKKAKVEENQFNLEDKVYFLTSSHDGRTYFTNKTYGKVVQINKVTVDIEDSYGNVWRERKSEVQKINLEF
jgi:hypothetical protein